MPRAWFNAIIALLRDRAANMSILMVGGIGVGLLVASNVIDYASLSIQKGTLQGLADRAALAAAQELIVSRSSDARVTAVAQAIVGASYDMQQDTTATVIDNGAAVRVDIVAAPKAFFPSVMSAGVSQVTVEATAEVSGGGNVCMIGLDPNSVATLKLANRARLSAPNCAVYSNSTSEKSVWIATSSRINADMVCSAGGVTGPDTAFTLSPPTTDCPAIDDPLRNRPNPNVGDLDDCDYTNFSVKPLKDVQLHPGIYCGGLSVMGGRARLSPGIYVMRDGQLNVVAGRLEGENVGFFLSGQASTVMFQRLSSISLTAPRTGDMAGLLFFEDRDTPFAGYHQISSLDARNLVGTIYVPKSRLLINTENSVADESDYTVIIAREFELRDGPELVLNTDYETSTIPLPDGVGNKTRSSIHLTK